MDRIEIRSKTKYPKLFPFYWGNRRYIPNDDDIIVNNRNQFIENYKIVKAHRYSFLENYTDIIKDNIYLDHTEYFKTKDNKYIIITSPYTDYYTDKFYEHGWVLIEKLYAPSAFTYFKVLESKEDVKLISKAHKEALKKEKKEGLKAFKAQFKKFT